MTSGTGTRESKTTSGSCYWYKIGRVVYVTFNDVTRNVAQSNVTLFTGLPPAIRNWYGSYVPSTGSTGKAYPFWITTDGGLFAPTPSGVNNFGGSITYISAS